MPTEEQPSPHEQEPHIDLEFQEKFERAAQHGWEFLSDHSREDAYADALYAANIIKQERETETDIIEEDVEAITADKKTKLLDAITIPTEEEYETWIAEQKNQNERLYSQYLEMGDPLKDKDGNPITAGYKTMTFVHGMSKWARENRPEIAETLGEIYAHADTLVDTSVEQFKSDWHQREQFGEEKAQVLKESLKAIDSTATKRLALRKLIKTGAENENKTIHDSYINIYENIREEFKPAREADILELRKRIEALSKSGEKTKLTELYTNIVEVVKAHFPEGSENYKKKRIQRARELLGAFVTPDKENPTKGLLLDTTIELSIEETKEEPIYNHNEIQHADQQEEISETPEVNSIEQEKEHNFNTLQRALESELGAEQSEAIQQYIEALKENGFSIVRIDTPTDPNGSIQEGMERLTIFLDPHHNAPPEGPQTPRWKQLLHKARNVSYNATTSLAFKTPYTDMLRNANINSLAQSKLRTKTGPNKWRLPNMQEAEGILRQVQKQDKKTHVTYVDDIKARGMGRISIGSGENARVSASALLDTSTVPAYEGFFSTPVLSLDIEKNEQVAT